MHHSPWTLRCALCVVTLMLFCPGLVLGVWFEDKPINIQRGDRRLQMNSLICGCSPSGRGHLPIQVTLLQKGLQEGRAAFERARGTKVDMQAILKAKDAMKDSLLKTMNACRKKYGTEACINADASLRKASAVQYCAYDTISGKNVAFYPEGSSHDLGTLKSCHLHKISKSPKTQRGNPKNTPNVNKSNVNEGCVAISHLKGLALQHAKHLTRYVLCNEHGFCATPNHAIIANGVWTSMKKMCQRDGKWACTEDVKLVNNLKIARHRRANVGNGIVITPYDTRFPKAFSWIVQIAEDVAQLVCMAVIFSFSLYVTILAWLVTFSAPSHEGQECFETQVRDTVSRERLRNCNSYALRSVASLDHSKGMRCALVR